MGRPPIGDRAMTSTERSHRHRAKQRAAVGATKRTETGCNETATKLEADNAALRARIQELETALAATKRNETETAMSKRLEADIRKRVEEEFEHQLRIWHWAYEVTVDPQLQRTLMKLAHPDREPDPKAKALIEEFSKTLNAAITEERGRKRRQEEARQKAAAEREERSQRSKEAHARRKAAAATKPATKLDA
jgi:hypothetical protein